MSSEPSSYLREHNEKNQKQHRVFLEAYEGASDYADLIEWFRSLPLGLDLGDLRVVHACWDEDLMRFLEHRQEGLNGRLSDKLLVAASRRQSDEYRAVETLLKGKEIGPPAGQSFWDKDGHPRQEIPVRSWD